MPGTLDVLVLHEDDARRAEEGGADGVVLVGSLNDGGMSPEPRLVERVRATVGVQLRPMVRLREGFGTDGGEFTHLLGLAASYLDAGADGLVFGFLNGLGEIDLEVCGALAEATRCPWTFRPGVDDVLDSDKAWNDLMQLPGLDQVCTAGSPRGVDQGLDELIRLAGCSPEIARRILATGGLLPEHVPWLVRAGVTSFGLDTQARPLGSWKAFVDAPLVRTWRSLLDDAMARQPAGGVR